MGFLRKCCFYHKRFYFQLLLEKDERAINPIGFPKEYVFKYDQEFASSREEFYKKDKVNWDKLITFKMNNQDIEETRLAIECIHNCQASHYEDVVVVEKYGPKTLWKRVVHTFHIEEKPKTDICYAWSSPIKGATKRRYYAILKIPPINSPEKTVRAAIVQT